LYFLFQQARARAIAESHTDPAEYGLQSNRAAIEQLARYAHEQGITPRAFGAGELFEVY
jgi:hypothetical protein